MIIKTDDKYYKEISLAIGRKKKDYKRGYFPYEMAQEINDIISADQIPNGDEILFGPTFLDFWGDELAVGDSKWWESLQQMVLRSSSLERKNLIGKTKKIILEEPVLGSKQILMRCIAADQDGDKTLTFESVYTLVDSISFGSSAIWIDSEARKYCRQIYDRCSAKNAIKKVKKGTCKSIANPDRNNNPEYTEETVFLLSEKEINGGNSSSPLSDKYSTINKSECTLGYNNFYSYYINRRDGKEIGNILGDSTNIVGNDFLRTRYYNAEKLICHRQGANGLLAAMQYAYKQKIVPVFVIG